MLGFDLKKIGFGILLAVYGLMNVSALNRESAVQAKMDSVKHEMSFSEYSHIYKIKRVSSTYPVEIRKKGNSLLVTSKHMQMLPVYKDNGVFYALFRLDKGTNWISGLPKGTYIINNSKIVVS